MQSYFLRICFFVHNFCFDTCFFVIFDGNNPTTKQNVFSMLTAWAEQAEKYRNGEITKEQYDEWRYNYPKFDTTQKWVKTPSTTIDDLFKNM